jgi:exodeoxyribonuclease-3
LDYQVVTPELGARVASASIAVEPRFSDHAPLLIEYRES